MVQTRQHWGIAIVLSLVGFNVCGCHKVHYVEQRVVIGVVNLEQEPMTGIAISIKESLESFISEADQGREGQLVVRWNSDFVPWYEGVTNNEGQVTFVAKRGYADGGFHLPGRHGQLPDVFSGKEYIVVVQRGDDESQFKFELSTGASVQHDGLEFLVVDISAPVIVK